MKNGVKSTPTKMEEKVNKVVRWMILALIVIAIGGIMIFNATKPVDHSDAVWDERATMGKMDAKNYYIVYTDLACPYCDVYARLVAENGEEFKTDYIEGKDILYEVRVTDFLYEFGEHRPDMSRWSAEGAYCAMDEGKFWEYYHGAVMALYNDYQSKGIGASKDSPMIEGMTEDYWVKLGQEIGLSEQFNSCMSEHKMLEKVKENTARAAKQVQGGLPYFKFNKFTTSGFDPSWDWNYVKRYLDAGL